MTRRHSEKPMTRKDPNPIELPPRRNASVILPRPRPTPNTIGNQQPLSLSLNLPPPPQSGSDARPTKPIQQPTQNPLMDHNPLFGGQQSHSLFNTLPNATTSVANQGQKDSKPTDPFGDLMSFNPPPKVKNDLLDNLDALYEQPNPSHAVALTRAPVFSPISTLPPALPSRGFTPTFMSPQHLPSHSNGQIQVPLPQMTKSISWTGSLNHQQTGNLNQQQSRPRIAKSTKSDYDIVSFLPPKNSSNQPGDSLIDFGPSAASVDSTKLTKVTVLEAFDPLLKEDVPDADDPEEIYHNSSALSETSFYEAYDPFEYMVSKTQRLELEEEHVYR